METERKGKGEEEGQRVKERESGIEVQEGGMKETDSVWNV